MKTQLKVQYQSHSVGQIGVFARLILAPKPYV